MQICLNCDGSNRDAARFCHACGQRLRSEQSVDPAVSAPQVVGAAASESAQDGHGLFSGSAPQHGEQLAIAANGVGRNHALDALHQANEPAENREGSFTRLKELYRRASIWGILFLLAAAAVVSATAISVASFAPWSKRVAPDVQSEVLHQSQQGVLTEGSVSPNVTADHAGQVGVLSESASQASASAASVDSQTQLGPQGPDSTAKRAAEAAISKTNIGKPASQATTSESPPAAVSALPPVLPEVPHVAEPANPQDLCAKRSVFLQNACLSEQCTKPSMSNHPQCQRLRKEREREEFNQLYGSP